MTRSIRTAIFVALSATPLSLHAQQIGTVTLPLGWQRQVVLQRLAKHYDVDASGIVRKKGPPYEILGSVGFEGGRLTSVSRIWKGAADTGAGAIVSALSQLDGDLSCRVRTGNTSGPDQEVKGVTVFCGAHSISISSGTHEGKPTQPTVTEAWRVRAFVDPRERPPAGGG